MNKEELRPVLKDLAEQKAPRAQIDLWPAIRSRLQASPQAGQPAPSQPWQVKLTYLLAGAMLIGALFLLHPQGRTLAQEVLHFFNPGPSNLMPGGTAAPVQWVAQTPGAAAPTLTPQPTPPGSGFEPVCGSYQAPRCTVAAIRQLVDFPVFALAAPPAGLRFTGAAGGPEQVHLFYAAPDQSASLILIEQPFTGPGSQLSMEVGAEAEVQSVQVGPAQAEYVKGTYDGNSSPPVWNSELDFQQLRWANQGVLFTLYLSGGASRWGRAELAALAAALTDGPLDEAAATAALGPTPAPFDLQASYPLALKQAEEKAGFAPLSPARLPDRLTFVGASYDEQTKVAAIAYRYRHPNHAEATDSLVIRQQLAPQGVDCDLCGFIPGNGEPEEPDPTGKRVSQEAVLQPVQTGDFTGQYLEGIGWVAKTGGVWQWDADPYLKRLRFQASGLAIEISAYTYELTQADLLAIAESLQ